jgi:hypothetical protein
MTLRTRWRAASSRQRIAAILAALWLLYVLAGYFLLSPLIRTTTINTLAEMTGREVLLERVVFNPAALSLSLRGFAIRDDDGGDLLAFDELYVNFELSSLLRWSWHFDRISLFAPAVRLVQTGSDSFNVDDILARLAADPAEPAPSETAPARLPRFSFRELLLVQGDFRFRDESRTEPDELVLAPVSFEIRDFSTRADGEGNNTFAFAVTGPAGGRLDWAGSLRLDPLVASGSVSLTEVDLTPFTEFFRDQVHFRVPSAQLDIATEYRFEADPDGVMRLSSGRLVLSDLVIRDPALEQPVLVLPTLTVSELRLDTVAEEVVIGELALEGPALDVRLQDEGLHLQSLFTPVAQAVGEDEVTEPVADTEEASSWQVTVERVRIRDGSVRLIDETLTSSGMLVLAPLSVSLDNLSTRSGERWRLEADVVLAEQGRLRLEGQGQLDPATVTVTLALDELPFPALEPWVRESALVRIVDGTMDARLNLEVSDAEANEVTLTGTVTVNRLAVQEGDGSSLLGFTSLVIDGIGLSLAEQRLVLASFTVTDLRAQSLVDAAGLDTAIRIMPVVASESGSASSAAESNDDWDIRIDSLRLRNGELVHVDRSRSPAFRIGLHRLDAELRKLDSRSRQPAELTLSAMLDQTGPFSVRGKVAPLASTPMVDIKVNLTGYDMNGLTPFTGQYLGYAVSSGQLAVDSQIGLQGSVLDSSSRVRAANFFLGDSVASDEALRVPIKLGLAVLRDQNGLIDLPVVARGDLADPSVSVAGIIVRAITNVLVKAATSPFSALAALAGGKEINHIDFVAGQAEPDDEGRAQMATLAQLLGERPTLFMNLSGSAQEQDRLPLAEQQLGRQLLGERWQDLQAALSDGDFRRRLQARYREQTGERAETLLAGDVVTDREQRDRVISERAFSALSNIVMQGLPTDALAELATARAQRSKAMLVEEFGLDGERLFIVAPRAGGADALSGVILELGAN